MKREQIIFALARLMRPEQFKKTVDANWNTEHLESLLKYYNENHE